MRLMIQAYSDWTSTFLQFWSSTLFVLNFEYSDILKDFIFLLSEKWARLYNIKAQTVC